MRTPDRERTLWILLGVLVAVMLVGMLVGGGMVGTGMMRGSSRGGVSTHMNGWSWGLGLGWLGVLALVVAVILAGFVFLRPETDHRGAAAEDPRAILHQRLVAGEIDQASYERTRRELDAYDRSTT